MYGSEQLNWARFVGSGLALTKGENVGRHFRFTWLGFLGVY